MLPGGGETRLRARLLGAVAPAASKSKSRLRPPGLAARGAFGTIAERVERSLFALRTLDSNDWQVAREAYASFALVRLERGSS